MSHARRYEQVFLASPHAQVVFAFVAAEPPARRLRVLVRNEVAAASGESLLRALREALETSQDGAESVAERVIGSGAAAAMDVTLGAGESARRLAAHVTRIAPDEIAVVAVDETERHAREERSARSHREHLAAVSHELRTPLVSILGWAKILGADDGDGESLRRGLAVIERSARAQVRIVEDLLDVTRIEQGKLEVRSEDVDLVAIAHEALEVVQPAALAKNITLRFERRPAACHLVGDADRLRQVLWNLLSNAVKFTPRDGAVDLDVADEDERVVVCVRDTGQGIDDELLPLVFEQYRHRSASGNQRHGGLGLGLSIVRALVARHGGSVVAESEGAGKGSTFTVTLPARR